MNIKGQKKSRASRKKSEPVILDLTDAQKHVWVKGKYWQWESCQICGVVKRKDGVPNKPCKGKTMIKVRE